MQYTCLELDVHRPQELEPLDIVAHMINLVRFVQWTYPDQAA